MNWFIDYREEILRHRNQYPQDARERAIDWNWFCLLIDVINLINWLQGEDPAAPYVRMSYGGQLIDIDLTD
jgi:hypothetical protein